MLIVLDWPAGHASTMHNIAILHFLDVDLQKLTSLLLWEPEGVNRDGLEAGMVSDIQTVVKYMCGVLKEGNSHWLKAILPANPQL